MTFWYQLGQRRDAREGSQQGIDIASRLFLDPGDLLLTEGPTYIGAMQAFDAYEPRYLQIPVDEEGMDLDLAEQMVAEAGQTPKMIYVIPNFQNPTGVTMSDARRDRLIALAEHWNAVILEDDPYGEFWYDNPPPHRLRQRSDRVIYLGTFSKTIAPGLRVGWMTLPHDLMGLALMAKESSEVNGVRDIYTSLQVDYPEVRVETDRTEGDPDNEMLRVVPAGPRPHAGDAAPGDPDALDHVFASLFTGPPPVVRVSESDPALKKVKDDAQKALPRLARAQRAGAELTLKAELGGGDAGVELMWVKVASCAESACTGTLANGPVLLTTMRAGDTVRVPFAKVVDYLLRGEDGGVEGGASIRILSGAAP